MAAHQWEEHGIPSRFEINGDVIAAGPQNPVARLLLGIDWGSFWLTLTNR
jgi:hypothetical protein